jgi:hypothetical protein
VQAALANWGEEESEGDWTARPARGSAGGRQLLHQLLLQLRATAAPPMEDAL